MSMMHGSMMGSGMMGMQEMTSSNMMPGLRGFGPTWNGTTGMTDGPLMS